MDELSNTLVVVADGARARLFARLWPSGELEELASFTCPEARLSERELTSDAPGHELAMDGVSRHEFARSESKFHHTEKFARRIGQEIQFVCASEGLSKVILIAAPRFLGLMRKQWPAHGKPLVILEMSKDVTRHKRRELADMVGAHVAHARTH